jgi:beta-phosphoglucomutase-like phosphatase (HAD superfamily)
LNASRTLAEKTACGSMSQGAQVRHVLPIIDLADAFDLVVGREEVVKGKPDPEIYLLISKRLGIAPEHCLVIEDSAAGLKAARAAGMSVLAVPTELSRDAVTAPGFLDPAQIIEDPRDLRAAVERALSSL